MARCRSVALERQLISDDAGLGDLQKTCAKFSAQASECNGRLVSLTLSSPGWRENPDWDFMTPVRGRTMWNRAPSACKLNQPFGQGCREKQARPRRVIMQAGMN